MTSLRFELDERISRFDLLKHPFYQAWSSGQLSPQELATYAGNYYQHVNAFPSYLKNLLPQLGSDTALTTLVTEHIADELGQGKYPGQAHSDLWLEFAKAYGAGQADVENVETLPQVKALIEHFTQTMSESPVEESLAALYAYEVQTPKVSKDKAKWLREHYGASEQACAYFDLHATYDEEHAEDWFVALESVIARDPAKRERVLNSAEATAEKLWKALDAFPCHCPN